MAVGGCGGTTVSTLAPAPTLAAASVASDWAMYGHDTSRTNYSPGETAITTANVGGLAPRFTATVGMAGIPSSSGPVVANGRVCVGSSVASGNNYFCFDAKTGAPIWSANLGHFPGSDGNVGIGATAAIGDGVLVVGGGDSAYYGLTADAGQILWRHSIQTESDSFAWASPLISGNVVYVGVSAQFLAGRGEVRALDLHAGTLLAQQWLVPEGQKGGDIWNSPTLSADGSTLVVATGNDFGGYDGPYTRAMVSLDPTTLAILDSHREATAGQDLDFGTTPVIFHDSGGRTLVGANEKNGTFFAYALGHLVDGPVWQRATGISVGAMPAYASDIGPGGTLFIVGDNGLLFGVDPATGADRWPPVAVGFACGNLAVVNGLVFMSVSGNVAVLDATNGTLLRILTPAALGPTYSGAVVSGGVVYWMAGPNLNAWGPS